MKHADFCCLNHLETLTDEQFMGVIEAYKAETERRWPRLFAKADELAEGHKDVDYKSA
jgi:hypothetical protein